MSIASWNLICLHGAGTGPWCFDDWSRDFPEWHVRAPDLLTGLDVATATMADYASAAVRATADVDDVVLCGWSMGGLVALMAAEVAEPAAIVVLEPSLPAELQGFHPELVPTVGTFDPADVYAAAPGDPTTRLESSFALGERRRGISVPSITVPLLVVAGKTYTETRGGPVADFYGADLIEFPNLHHVALVQEREVRTAIGAWLSELATRPQT
jgi:fermentation-respiration switch protein FrsA (DUF1100 family)